MPEVDVGGEGAMVLELRSTMGGRERNSKSLKLIDLLWDFDSLVVESRIHLRKKLAASKDMLLLLL